MKRLAFIIGWMLAVTVVWWALGAMLGRGLAYAVNERQVRVPDWFFSFLNIAGPIGLLVLPLLFGVLGLRGRLPGTDGADRAAADPAARPCPACGYDRRATPGRCPECGHTGRYLCEQSHSGE